MSWIVENTIKKAKEDLDYKEKLIAKMNKRFEDIHEERNVMLDEFGLAENFKEVCLGGKNLIFEIDKHSVVFFIVDEAGEKDVIIEGYSEEDFWGIMADFLQEIVEEFAGNKEITVMELF